MNRRIAGVIFSAAVPMMGMQKSIPLFETSARIAYPLKVVHFTDSPWSEPEIIQQLNDTNKIFSPCDFRFSDITLLTTPYNPSVLDLPDIRNFAKSLKAVGFRRAYELTAVFIRNITGWMLTISKDRIIGFATSPAGFSQQTAEDQDLMVGMIFMTELATWSEYKADRPQGHSAVAHEFGHILLNQGHVNFPNFMGVHGNTANSVTAQQCETMRTALQNYY